MKTVEQAKTEQVPIHDEAFFHYSDQDIWKEGFEDGVKFAQEWISVDDELPQVPDAQNSINPFFIIAKDLIKHGYATIRIDVPIDIKFLKNSFTHWRPIERI